MILLVLATAMLWSSGVAPPASASLVAEQGCPYISAFPTNFSFSNGGGSNIIHVSNPQSCYWTVTNHDDYFISVTNVDTLYGEVDFSVAPNYYGTPRNGTITINDGGYSGPPIQTIQISQQGSTLSLYRYWNAGIYNHYYTTNFSELGNGANGYVFEKVEGHVYGSQVSGTVPLKRYYCAENGDHFYTTNPNEPGPGLPCYQFERVEAYVFPNQVSGTVPLYRYYEPNNYDHFYTTNYNELRTGGLGWYLEGVQCYVFPP